MLAQVSVKGSHDREEAWYDDFCSRCPDAALRERLRAMCGISALRATLQAAQLDHMLQNHPAITANLSRSLHQVNAMQRVSPCSSLQRCVGCQHGRVLAVGECKLACACLPVTCCRTTLQSLPSCSAACIKSMLCSR